MATDGYQMTWFKHQITRKRLLLLISAIAAVGALLLHYKQRDSYRCDVCFAKKDHFQWRMGSWRDASIPLTPSWQQIEQSRFSTDFFPIDHSHEWMFAQGSPYRFFGTSWGGCAIGRGRHVSQLFEMYESSEEFREFIAAKMQAGTLTKSNVVALISTTRFSEPTSLQKEADELLEAFFAQ